jgi:hypothetical protein
MSFGSSAGRGPRGFASPYLEVALFALPSDSGLLSNVSQPIAVLPTHSQPLRNVPVDNLPLFIRLAGRSLVALRCGTRHRR